MTPDRQVQEAIRGLFLRFPDCGSLRQALVWYHDEKILFPTSWKRGGVESVEWRLPHYQQLLRIVKNPTYAGAFAWGRTASRSELVDGRSRKSEGHELAIDEWQVLIKDHHPGYISWDQFVANRQTLKSNRTKMHQTSTGAARKGTALLAGLLRCTKCGQKLKVGYRGRDGRAPRYYCSAGNRARTTPECLSFGGVRAENALVDVVLEACGPLGVEASLGVLDEGREQQDQKQRALELALEKAQFEERRARRQYDAADPDNRLVSAELEKRWNASLSQVEEIEGRLREERRAEPQLDDGQRERLLSLGADLRALWGEGAAPMDLKKRILRTVINEILVGPGPESRHIEMKIHWAGGVHTALRVSKNKVGRNTNATGKDVAAFVKELATAWRDPHIASILNRAGFRTGKGNGWNENRVKNLRRENKIPPLSKSEGRTWKTMTEAAAELSVSMCVVRTMVRNKLLPARQIAGGAPWMIEGDDLHLREVQQYARRARAGKTAPCGDNNQTLNL